VFFSVKGEAKVERYDLPELIELEATLLAIEETEKQLSRLQARLEALPAEISKRIGNNETLRLKIAHYLYWHVQELPTDKVGILVNEGVAGNVCRLVGPAIFEVPCERCGQPFEREFSSRTNLNLVISNRKYKLDEDKALCKSCREALEFEKERRDEEQTKRIQVREAKRKTRLEELRTMPYSEYLLTSEWDETRKRALKRAGYRCQTCNQANCKLHVHHRTYKRLGEEWNSDLIVLCGDCHELFHQSREVTQ
jgi:5-methylcytosine-specific restriction endonuclease McrA